MNYLDRKIYYLCEKQKNVTHSTWSINRVQLKLDESGKSAKR